MIANTPPICPSSSSFCSLSLNRSHYQVPRRPDPNPSLSLSPLTNLFSPSPSSTRPRALVHNAGWRCNPDSIADPCSYTTTSVR
ncbi:hypothetical protein Hanom_Chr15g01382451 [Helianthus anomalus]